MNIIDYFVYLIISVVFIVAPVDEKMPMMGNCNL